MTWREVEARRPGRRDVQARMAFRLSAGLGSNSKTRPESRTGRRRAANRFSSVSATFRRRPSRGFRESLKRTRCVAFLQRDGATRRRARIANRTPSRREPLFVGSGDISTPAPARASRIPRTAGTWSRRRSFRDPWTADRKPISSMGHSDGGNSCRFAKSPSKREAASIPTARSSDKAWNSISSDPDVERHAEFARLPDADGCAARCPGPDERNSWICFRYALSRCASMKSRSAWTIWRIVARFSGFLRHVVNLGADGKRSSPGIKLFLGELEIVGPGAIAARGGLPFVWSLSAFAQVGRRFASGTASGTVARERAPLRARRRRRSRLRKARDDRQPPEFRPPIPPLDGRSSIAPGIAPSAPRGIPMRSGLARQGPRRRRPRRSRGDEGRYGLDGRRTRSVSIHGSGASPSPRFRRISANGAASTFPPEATTMTASPSISSGR